MELLQNRRVTFVNVLCLGVGIIVIHWRIERHCNFIVGGYDFQRLHYIFVLHCFSRDIKIAATDVTQLRLSLDYDTYYTIANILLARATVPLIAISRSAAARNSRSRATEYA